MEDHIKASEELYRVARYVVDDLKGRNPPKGSNEHRILVTLLYDVMKYEKTHLGIFHVGDKGAIHGLTEMPELNGQVCNIDEELTERTTIKLAGGEPETAKFYKIYVPKTRWQGYIRPEYLMGPLHYLRETMEVSDGTNRS